MIYFDNAATSFPKSEAVLDAMNRAYLNCGNSGRSGHIYALNSAETVYTARKRLAKLFNTRPECVIFTSGATAALNMAIKGTNRYGGVTVISSMEHNAVLRPAYRLRRDGETVLRQFAVDVFDDSITLDNFSSVCRSATTVAVTHASNVCGRILPIKRMRELAPEDAVFILDASQTAGHIPIDIVELGVDIICIPAHKGLGGPMGVGALILNPYSDIYIEPLLEGGTGINSKSPDMPELFPERLESGTLNIYGIAGLSEAVKSFDYPIDERKLFEYLVSETKNLVNIIIYGLDEKSDLNNYVPVLAFNRIGTDCEELCDYLSECGFALRAGYHCAPLAHKTLGSFESGTLRLSLGRYNKKSEIDAFLAAISEYK